MVCKSHTRVYLLTNASSKDKLKRRAEGLLMFICIRRGEMHDCKDARVICKLKLQVYKYTNIQIHTSLNTSVSGESKVSFAPLFLLFYLAFRFCNINYSGWIAEVALAKILASSWQGGRCEGKSCKVPDERTNRHQCWREKSKWPVWMAGEKGKWPLNQTDWGHSPFRRQ